MFRMRICVVGTALWAFFPLPAVVRGNPSAPDAAPERHVRYSFTVQNATDQVVPAAELWEVAPLTETSTRRRLDLKAAPAPESREDNLGNHLLEFALGNMPPNAVRIATVEATLAMSAESVPLDAAQDRWLQSEPLFEYADETFDRLAPHLPEEHAELFVRAAFDWVRGHLQAVGHDQTDRGALDALEQKNGDCTEYAVLFVALCRRAGIPARAMGGYMVSPNAVLHPAWRHNWAESYLDGRWHIADPQAEIIGELEERYVATRVLGASDSPPGNLARFRCVGEGLKAEMNK